jgi:type 1 glutamine amidotransferase
MKGQFTPPLFVAASRESAANPIAKETGVFTRRLYKPFVFALLGAACVMTSSYIAHAAQPKKVLVVTVTKGFRHSSIATAEKVLGELGTKSGIFTVDYARVEPTDPKFKNADGITDTNKVDAAIRQVLAEKMSPAALKNYDAVIFANTTGDLPLPDKQAFLDWIKSGKGFVGMHSATDTFRGHKPLDSYVEMVGGEFRHHDKQQADVDCINQDAQHPATKMLPPLWHVRDEIYLLNGFERTNVHGLLRLDKEPNYDKRGDYPISWCKMYGKGRVFYTSLGHREDVWDPNTPASFKRENPTEVSEAYQKHILGGIKWALGLEKGSTKLDKPIEDTKP